MDQSERDKTNEPSAKYRKLDNRSVREDGDAVVSHQNQSPQIFKLNIDCIEEIFDYLVVYELLKVGNTCKLLQLAVGSFFKQYFPRILKYFFCYDNIRVTQTFLAEFLESIHLESESDYKYLLEIQPRLGRIKEMIFFRLELIVSKLQRIVGILKNVERLEIFESSFDGNLHDDLLTYCPNLKELIVRDVDQLNINANIGSDWTLQKYPKLEYFMWKSVEKMSGSANFLEINPNIRTFVIAAHDLWANRNMMMTAKVSLNTLGINLRGHDLTMLFARLLQKLHMRGVYKRLQLLFYDISSQETIALLASLNVPIVCLKILDRGEDYTNVQLSDLIHLEEIRIVYSNRVTNIEVMANKLTRLERIFFDCASFKDILPLISRAANLRKITVINLEGGVHFNPTTKVIDLPALKKMREKLREKLAAVKQVILYVKEDIYLTNKWTHGTTDFDVIRIMRYYSCDRMENILMF